MATIFSDWENFDVLDRGSLMGGGRTWMVDCMKTNDKIKLHWNAYRHFRQEVKREIRLAEKEHVRSEIRKSNGNTNSIWKILNRYISRKNTPLAHCRKSASPSKQIQ